MTRDTAQHMIRTPDERIIYIAGDRKLYKLFYDTGEIVPMLAVEAGEQGHMIGYAELAQRPQAAGLIIGSASTSPGGVWHYDGSAWRLKNNGLPPGRTWSATAASPTNSSIWLAWGSTASGIGVSGSTGSAGGHMIDKLDGLSPLYITTTAGALWSAVELPAPYLYIDLASKVSMPTPRIAFTSAGEIAIFGSVNGIGNFFGAPDPGLALWRGPAEALAVLSANPDNADEHPLGDTTSVSAYDLAAGASGALILSANFGSRFGLPGNEAARISSAASAVAYISSTDAPLRLDRRPGGASVIAIGGATVLGALDYELEQLATLGTLAANTEPQTTIAAASDGVYYGRYNSGNTGIWKIADPFTAATAGQVGALGRPIGQLAAAQQGNRPTIAARETYTPDAAGQPAAFWIGLGPTWRSIPGPETATNAQLCADAQALAALAITT